MMYGSLDLNNPWNLPNVFGACDHSVEYDSNDGQMQDEESMDQAEIEALLYAQIYFEPNNNEEQVQLVTPDTGYDIDVKEETNKSEEKSEMNSSFASMVNFSGRSYMSSEVSTPQKKVTKHKKQKTSTSNTRWREETLGKAKSALRKLPEKIAGNSSSEEDQPEVIKKDSKKKKKSKQKVIVLSDSGESYVEEDRHKKKKHRKRKGKAANVPVTIKKTKKSDVVVLDSFSDGHVVANSESDSDLLMLEDTGSDSEDLIDIELNIDGDWGTFKDPHRTVTPDLSTIDLATWDGSPALTIREVTSLLQACHWKLIDDDRYGLLRTYGSSRITCRNCNEKGHIARDCHKPKKVQKCALCGKAGHFYKGCPTMLCFNCDLPGHTSRDCSAPRTSWRTVCRRCGYEGHIQSRCSELWRQYHLSTKPGPVVEIEQKENKAVFCYNCGRKGHFGSECNKDRVNQYSQPVSPFVVYYTGSTQNKQLNKQDSFPKKSKKKNRDKYRDRKASSSNVLCVPTLKDLGKTWTAKNKKREGNSKQYNDHGESLTVSSLKQLKKSKVKQQKQQKAEVKLQQGGTIFDTAPGTSSKTTEFKRITKQNKKAKKMSFDVNVADNEPIDVDDVDLFSVAGSVHGVSLLENNVGLEGTAKQLAPEVLSVSSEETSPDAKLNFHACSIKSSKKQLASTPASSSSKAQKPKRGKKKKQRSETQVCVIDDDVDIISCTGSIPGVVSWWEDKAHDDINTSRQQDPNFDNILNGSFQHMSSDAKRNFQARLTKAAPGLQIRSGRRTSQDVNCKTKKVHKQPYKERRKKVRPGPQQGDLVKAIPVESVEPIPESNIGNRMLRSMGWKPGSGLGVDGCGMTTPIIASILPYRRGLGDINTQPLHVLSKVQPLAGNPANTTALSSRHISVASETLSSADITTSPTNDLNIIVIN